MVCRPIGSTCFQWGVCWEFWEISSSDCSNTRAYIYRLFLIRHSMLKLQKCLSVKAWSDYHFIIPLLIRSKIVRVELQIMKVCSNHCQVFKFMIVRDQCSILLSHYLWLHNCYLSAARMLFSARLLSPIDCGRLLAPRFLFTACLILWVSGSCRFSRTVPTFIHTWWP